MHKLLIIPFLLVSLNADARQTRCLAQAIYHEARGEPIKCQHMVADVVLNRMQHRNYPSTVCGVVFQRSQFSWTRHSPRITDNKAWQRSIELARYKLLTRNKTTTAIYFTQGRRFGPVVARCGKLIFMGNV